MAHQVERIDESRNGVRVIVHRSANGSIVEADCHCYGSWLRTHSNPNCPVLAVKMRERIDKAKEPAL
jgi:hypothetical protein